MTEGQTVLCLWLPMVASTVVWTLNFDRLMRYYHEHEHEHWVSNGSPGGFFWYPKGDRHHFFLGFASDKNRARNRLSYRLLYTTPDWLARSDRSVTFLRNYRWGTAASAFFTLGLIIYVNL